LAAVFVAGTPLAQLTPLDSTQYHSDSPVYTDPQGNLYSTDVFARFGSFVVDTPPPTERVSDSHVRSSAVLSVLSQIDAGFGAFDLDKMYPHAAWGQTASTNVRTGTQVHLLDVSQVVRLRFAQPVSVDSVAADLLALSETLWAEGPLIVETLAEPDDPNSTDIEYRPMAYPGAPGSYPLPHYNEDRIQWALHRLNAVDAWELARAHEPVLADRIMIGIPDRWSSTVTYAEHGFDAVHPDFRFEPGVPQIRENLRLDVVSGNYGLQHGLKVASYASPISDNGIYHAGLAWDAMMRGYSFAWSGVAAAACVGTPVGCEPVDIINASFASFGYSSHLEDIVYNALARGIVVVAGAVTANGNSQIAYPAAYTFPNPNRPDLPPLSAQVIAATGADYQDEHPSLLGYSAGTDPVANPRSAYIDVAASTGTTIKLFTLPTSGTPVYGASYDEDPATSWASPRIASLAALLLSVNDSLTPDQVHEALTETARKTGQYAYNSQTGYNRYLGYGLADAYEAVRYVLEHFGGEIGGDPEGRPYRLRDPLAIRAGATVTVLAGTELLVDEDLVVEAGGELVIEPNATLRFYKEAALAVSGTLEADGAELVAQAQLGWEGLDVLAGGYAHLTGGTVLEGVGYGPASVYVAGGEVLIDGTSEVSGLAGGAPRGVYVTSGQIERISYRGEAYLAGGARIELHDGDGVYAYNDGEAVVESSFILENGGAGIAAFGQSAGAYAVDTELTQNGQALSASFSATAAAYNPNVFAGTPTYPNLTATDQGVATLFANFSGSVQTGTGKYSNSRNNDFSPDAEDHARAFDGGAITAEFNYWGFSSGPDPSRVVTAGTFGPGTFDGCPYLRSGSASDEEFSCGASTSRSGNSRSGEGNEPSGPLQAAYRALEAGELMQSALLLGTAVVEGDPAQGDAGPALALAAVPRLVLAARDRAPEALNQAIALLDQHAEPGRAHRTEALRALIRVRLALGDEEGALTLTEDLLADVAAGAADPAGAYADRALALVSLGEFSGAEAALAAGEAAADEASEELVRARYDFAARMDALGLSGADEERVGKARSAALGRSTPGAFAVGTPYPNPAGRAATLTLPLELPNAAEVRAEVFDVLGRRVASVETVRFAEGERRLLVPMLGLAAGTYVARVSAAEEDGSVRVESRRFTVVR
jgi:hypothetical protein